MNIYTNQSLNNSFIFKFAIIGNENRFNCLVSSWFVNKDLSSQIKLKRETRTYIKNIKIDTDIYIY